MIVRLTPAVMEQATNAGLLRHDEAIRQGRRNKHGLSTVGMREHIMGALGEAAVATAAGLDDWRHTVNTYKDGGDVGQWQVRTRKRGYDLLVRRDDRDEDAFILVVPLGYDEFEIQGWAAGYEAKQPKYLAEYGGREPAFFMPAADLRPGLPDTGGEA